jgi:hypothetical protein
MRRVRGGAEKRRIVGERSGEDGFSEEDGGVR